MKLLTVTVPCYNSAAYMSGAIESLLPAGNELEIIIIDDGSKDDTAKIADDYAARYPEIVRVIHQENGGHGEGINQGLAHANGLYFKVLDSDDRLDTEKLKELMPVLRGFAEKEAPDLIVHDYVYDHGTEREAFSVSYGMLMKANQISKWSGIRRFPAYKQFMIHCLIYRTQVLRDMHLVLPKHIFYEDNLYIYRPLPHTDTVYYYPAKLYGYQIGREDQSINEKVILKRLDQQTSITEQMVTSFTLAELNTLPKTLRDYMINASVGQLSVVSALQYLQNDASALAMNEEMWEKIRAFDKSLYKELRRKFLGWAVSRKSKWMHRAVVFSYRTAHKVMKF